MITPITNHFDSSPHNSPPGFDGSMNNRTIPINLYPKLKSENTELDILSKVYYFIEMYFSQKVSIPSDEISALKFLIESFKKNNYSIEQYYAIFAIINRLLNSPAYANHLNTIENNMTNISLDKMTKEILKCISKDFNTFSPILLPELFSKFYDKLKKEFNVWGDHSISKNLFNNPNNGLSTL